MTFELIIALTYVLATFTRAFTFVYVIYACLPFQLNVPNDVLKIKLFNHSVFFATRQTRSGKN